MKTSFLYQLGIIVLVMVSLGLAVYIYFFAAQDRALESMSADVAVESELATNATPTPPVTTNDTQIKAVLPPPAETTVTEPKPANPAATTTTSAQKPAVTPTPETPTPTPVTPTTTPVTPTPAPDKAPLTSVEVAKHKSAESCWSIIDGNVYNLTAYIPKHPGGKQEILSICGKDGSKAFEGQHGGESKPAKILASYLLGPLAE